MLNSDDEDHKARRVNIDAEIDSLYEEFCSARTIVLKCKKKMSGISATVIESHF